MTGKKHYSLLPIWGYGISSAISNMLSTATTTLLFQATSRDKMRRMDLMSTTSGTNVIKLFTVVIYKCL